MEYIINLNDKVLIYDSFATICVIQVAKLQNMSKWQYILIITSLISGLTCDPYLTISRTDHGEWSTAPHTIIETTGSELYLTCSLLGVENVTSNGVVWGRRTNDLKFDNIADLIKLAKNGSKQLLNLDDQVVYKADTHTVNKATKAFDPLTTTDRGKYFCMNLKNMLFKIIRVQVKEEATCTQEQFQCDNGEKCLEQHEVCDGVYQCRDGSDEQICSIKKQCMGNTISCGADCIPIEWCCDTITDRDCFITVRNNCCPPLPGGGETVLMDDTDNFVEIPKSYSYIIILGVSAAVIIPVVLIFAYISIRNHYARASNNQDGGLVPPRTPIGDNDNSMILTSLTGIGNNNSLQYLDLPPTYADSTRNTPIHSHQSSSRGSLEDVTVDNNVSLPPTYREALANLKSLSNRPDSAVPTHIP